MHTVESLRVAVVLPYWDFWAGATSFDLRQSRDELTADAVALIDEFANVVLAEVLDESNAAGVQARLGNAAVDAICIVQSMATPPAVSVELLARYPRLPLVVWAARTTGRVADGFDHEDVTAQGATVGAPMLTSVLVRQGRSFELVVASLDEPGAGARVREAIEDAIAVARVRQARVGRVGRPIAGYDCVDLDPGRLARETGVTIVDIEPSEFTDCYRDVPAELLRSALGSVRVEFAGVSSLDTNALERAVRARLALEQLVHRYQLDAGAFNCHVPEVRLGDVIGIAPCFALGCLTSEGIPWTCAGDVVTVVGMLALKALGAAALYHELEAFDAETGVFVQANTGEHDTGLNPGQMPELVTNPWFGGPVESVCVRMSPRPGPATLVGFAQIDVPPQHRLIIASGEFVGGGYPATGTSNAGFRFRGGSATESWERWCRAGANHHGAVAPGDHVRRLARIGDRLGFDVVTISERGPS